MALKSKSGLQSVVFGVTKGTLIEGDAGTDLADDSWFMIDAAAATGSELPFADEDVVVGRVFKTGVTAAAITPAEGDNVYPLTFTKVCKTDASISTEKGTLDVTDDCQAGYNAYITDGYSDISGSLNGFLKFDDGDGSLGGTQEEWLNKFFDIQTDDGEGAYTLSAKNDDDIFLAILMNKAESQTEGVNQQWLMIPAILTGTTTDKPLKGIQNLDLNWNKAQGPACIYQRTTNATETVF